MSPVVLDSSVILALLNQETGAENIKPLLANSIMSTVNIAEVAGLLASRHELNLNNVNQIIEQLIDEVVDFDKKQAFIAAELEIINKVNKLGLSLGDKACIALGVSKNAPIYTADQAWKKLDFKAANINLIR